MKESRAEKRNAVSAITGAAISKRILLADDNKIIRDVVSGFLELIGYEVVLAIDGMEALSAFLTNSFELVLTDLEMPVMDGLSLAGHIKARSPNTPVILLTGSDRETVLERVKKGLVDSVIFKPFMLEDLQSSIQGALATRDEAPGAFWAPRLPLTQAQGY